MAARGFDLVRALQDGRRVQLDRAHPAQLRALAQLGRREVVISVSVEKLIAEWARNATPSQADRADNGLAKAIRAASQTGRTHGAYLPPTVVIRVTVDRGRTVVNARPAL